MEFTKPKKIFIVYDDVMLTEALSDYLTRKVPHQVSCYHTGEEALKHIGSNPEIIILDFYMNTVVKDASTGMEVLEAIHKNYPNTKVIMLSDQDSLETATNCINNGAYNYFSKNEVAFIRINNSLVNIIESIEAAKKGVKLYQLAFVIIVLSFLMSYIFY